MTNSRDIAQTMAELVRKGVSVENVTKRTIEFLSERNLLELAPGILKQLKYQSSLEYKEQTLSIMSTYELSQKTITEIRKHLGAPNDAPVAYITNRTLTSGFIARFAGRVYDGSGKTQLKTLQQSLIAQIV